MSHVSKQKTKYLLYCSADGNCNIHCNCYLHKILFFIIIKCLCKNLERKDHTLNSKNNIKSEKNNKIVKSITVTGNIIYKTFHPDNNNTATIQPK